MFLPSRPADGGRPEMGHPRVADDGRDQVVDHRRDPRQPRIVRPEDDVAFLEPFHPHHYRAYCLARSASRRRTVSPTRITAGSSTVAYTPRGGSPVAIAGR